MELTWSSRVHPPPPRLGPGRMPRGRRAGWLAPGSILAWLLGLVMLQGTPSTLGADAAAVVEYKVKGGFLYNFLKFVEWPANARPAAGQPIVIGVLDSDVVGPVLRDLFSGKEVDSRPIEVQTVNPNHSGGDWQILFVSRFSSVRPLELASLLGDRPVLLVGERAGFAHEGGIINFVIREDKVRLEINLEAAEQRGLKVSSKLAALSTLVKPGTAAPP